MTCDEIAILDTGIEVSLANGALSGFIRKSDLSRERSEQRSSRFAIGKKVAAKILTLERASHKVTLSIKAREVDEDRQAMASYGSSYSGASSGDILGAAISKAKDKKEKKKKR